MALKRSPPLCPSDKCRQGGPENANCSPHPLSLRGQADDPELEVIRQRRMAQLMGQRGGAAPGAGPANPEEAAAQEEAREAAEEQRRAMLMGLMQPAARDRRERGGEVLNGLTRAVPTSEQCCTATPRPASLPAVGAPAGH